MSKQIIVVAALGAVAFMVYQKTKAEVATRPVTQAPTDQPSVNVNGDMWAKILGSGAWKQLLGGTEANGAQAFVMRDWLGRPVTSDGVPVGSGDYLSDFVTYSTGLPSLVDEYRGSALYDSVSDFTTGAWVSNDGVSPMEASADGLRIGAGGVDFRNDSSNQFGWYRPGEQ